MKLTVVNSGSKGNCYVLHNDSEALMIEAGAPFSEVLQAVGAEVCTSIKGCLLSHEHGDHAKYVKDTLDHAIPVYATSGTIGALKTRSSKVMKPVNFRLNHATPDEDSIPWMTEHIGGFSVLPFKTVHDAVSPCGFYIHHEDFGCLLFATDTRFIPNTFQDLTNIMIECNYDEKLLEERTDIPDNLKDRIRRSHQSVTTCIKALRANDLSKVYQIILMHISEGDGDVADFEARVTKAIGIRAYAATKRSQFEISRTPF
mgnify:CR=1 FL=1